MFKVEQILGVNLLENLKSEWHSCKRRRILKLISQKDEIEKQEHFKITEWSRGKIKLKIAPKSVAKIISMRNLLVYAHL